ncbi:MAG: EAL domain-containing protein [Acidimicrobiales bacterium]|nr:EAL domain-containing protein [Acidimicrobiales bacterium]
MITTRVLTLVILSVLALVLPGLGEHRIVIAMIPAGLLAPAAVLIERYVPAVHADSAHTLLNVVTVSGLVFFAPDLWYALVLIMATDASVGVVVQRSGLRYLSAVIAVAGTTVSGLVLGIERWYLLVAAMLAIAPQIRNYGLESAKAELEASLQLDQMVSDAEAIFWDVDLMTGELLSITGDVRGLLGFDADELVGQFARDTVPEHERLMVEQVFAEVLQTGEATWVSHIQHFDGHWVTFRHTAKALFDRQRPIFRATGVDISELASANRQLKRQSDIFDRMNAAVLVVERHGTEEGRIVQANPATRSVVGVDPAETIGKTLDEAAPDWVMDHRAELGESLVDGAARVIDRAADGSVAKALDFSLFDLPNDEFAVYVEDVTEAVRANDTILHQAEHDELTGLVNRAVLQDALERAVDDKGRRRTDRVALMMLDLDRFKDVNDTLGHGVGDELLRTIANRLQAQVRDTDLVARLGGDEFAILLTDDVTKQRVALVADRISEACATIVDFDELRISVSASIGIALVPDHGRDATTLLRRADIAMYAAKNSSVDYRFYDHAPEQHSLKRLQLTSSIGRAIENDEFELWFQPKVNLRTKRIVGLEGLVRWEHPEHGVMAPNDFLELVHLAGEYHSFTDRVIDMGIQQIADCRDLGFDLHVAVNLSTMSLHSPELPRRIARTLAARGVPAEQLVLEITESDILDEGAAPAEVIGQFADMGVMLSIDDFGTGHSSLRRLRRLPFRELKIDRGFVASLLEDESDLVIVRSVIEMARSLGRSTVAEGIEDEATATLLTELGCDMAQGYLFCRPLHPSALPEFLRTWNGQPTNRVRAAIPAAD